MQLIETQEEKNTGKETPKVLSEDLQMDCYICGMREATHLCRYRHGGLIIQMCLCHFCMNLDTAYIFKNTITPVEELDLPPSMIRDRQA